MKFKKEFEKRLLFLSDSLNLYFYGRTFRKKDDLVFSIYDDADSFYKNAYKFRLSALYYVFSYVWSKNVYDLKKKV